ncbi:hypothetical protein F5Y09DRAFT_305546 [Xylaria sp. FL1042]|nr:hypothetical protein F5Y09DRAFT_305546 [Xylaria sp. FL1042]
MMITGSEISSTLGAISKIYSFGKAAWKFYDTTQKFGQDFETSMEDFHVQEWVFGSHLDLFKVSLEAYPRADTEREQQRKGIANLIDQLIDIFNATYDIVKQYDTQCSYGICTAHQHETDRQDTATDEINHHKAPEKLRKTVETPSNDRGAIDTWVIMRSKKLEQKLKELHESQTKPVGISKEGEPEYKANMTTAASGSLAVNHERRRELRLEKQKRQQESARPEDLVSWAAHGKEDFETSVTKLKSKNEELRNLLSYLPPKDPFRKIRPFREKSGLWEAKETIRDDIVALHRALRKVNRTGDQHESRSIELAVKLETKPKDLFKKLERHSRIDEDATPNRVISLLPNGPTGALKAGMFLAGTTIPAKRCRDTFANLSARLSAMESPEYIVGHIEGDARSCHDLRIMSVADELDHGHTLYDIIQPDGRLLHAKTRRAISAKIAMAHVHFSDINSGTVHRHLGSYQVFPLAEDPTQPQDWKPKEIASLYVNFGFGQPVQAPVVEKLPSDKDWSASLIDSAVELGVLIFQTAALKPLEYPHTAQGLDLAREKIIEKYLGELERQCGLFIREVVQICFINSYQSQNNRWEEERILAEVASALDHYTNNE